jgi:hypothetical protein
MNTKIALALLSTLTLPAYFVAFAVLWLVAWLCAVLALTIGLITAGKGTLPPISEELGEILRLPKTYCLQDFRDRRPPRRHGEQNNEATKQTDER